MILECLGCHKPYDVTAYKPGTRLRCDCGQILEVPDRGVHPRAVRTLHCSSCGGPLEKGRSSCSFCGALVDLSSSKLTAYCPECFAMSREGAAFCSGCGKPLTVVPDRPSAAPEPCPRCSVPMRNRTLDAHRVLECPVCLGMFVSVDAFSLLIRRQEERVGELAEERGGKSVLTAGPVTYIKCPECGGVMNRMNYGRISGVIVDYCRAHGYWLDNGELEKIARFVAAGGLKERYRLDAEEAKSAASRARMAADASRSASSAMVGVDSGAESYAGIGLLKFIAGLFD